MGSFRLVGWSRMVRVQVSEQVLLPVSVVRAWVYLGDTARMVARDPLLESYEPEQGVLVEGTTNRVVSRVGPLRVSLVTSDRRLGAAASGGVRDRETEVAAEGAD
jgi:hypothetical protein